MLIFICKKSENEYLKVLIYQLKAINIYIYKYKMHNGQSIKRNNCLFTKYFIDHAKK